MKIDNRSSKNIWVHCLCLYSNQKRKKLDDKGEKYIFLGISDYSKTIKYIILTPLHLLLVEMLFFIKFNFGHKTMMVLIKIL
jgi:hypothetical protein